MRPPSFRAFWGAGAIVVALAPTGGCSSFKDDGASTAGDGGDAGTDSSMTGTDSSVGPSDTGAPHDATTGTDGSSDGAAGADTGSVADSGSGDDGGDCTADGGCPVEVVVDNLNQATGVLVDSNNVYFGDEGTVTGSVYQCPKTGCATPVPLGPGYATGLGVDAQNVYWNDFSGGTVVRCAIGGCANQPTVIAPSQPYAEGVSFDGTNLYWASQGNVVTCIPPACAMPVTLATGQSTTITTVASATDVAYWIDNGNPGSVKDCAAAGCSQAPSTLSPGTGASVVVKNGFAYFTSGNAVVSCPTTQPCTTPHTIGSSDAPYGLGTDGTDIYWLDSVDPYVFRCSVTGCNGSATHFADTMYSQPGANVALDGEYAYWTIPPQVLRKHK